MITSFTAMEARLPPGAPLPGAVRSSARRLVHPELVAKHVADLAEGRPAAQRLLHGQQQVLRAASGGPHVLQGSVNPRLFARRPHRTDTVRLLALQLGVD